MVPGVLLAFVGYGPPLLLVSSYDTSTAAHIHPADSTATPYGHEYAPTLAPVIPPEPVKPAPVWHPVAAPAQPRPKPLRLGFRGVRFPVGFV